MSSKKQIATVLQTFLFRLEGYGATNETCKSLYNQIRDDVHRAMADLEVSK